MPDFLLRNWPLKLLALALAFGVWASVTGERDLVQDFQAPLTLRLTSDRVLATDPPTTVTVRLRGGSAAIRRLDALRLGVSVDLRDGLVGSREIPLGVEHLAGIPRDVSLEFINPNRLSLVVDRRVRKTLPVEPTFVGVPPEGYTFYGARTEPATLEVDGPESEMEQLEVIQTDPIRLADLTEPETRVVNAVPAQPHVRLVAAISPSVRVIVDATPVERSFEEIKVVLSGARLKVAFTPAKISVTLTGPPHLLDRILPQLMTAQADGSTLTPRPEPYDLELTLLADGEPFTDHDRIMIQSMSQATARVRVLDGSVVP